MENKKHSFIILILVICSFFNSSCTNTEEEEVIANFETSLEITNDSAILSITNLSEGASTYLWNFEGATESTSILETPNPIIYTQNGTYSIGLIATNGVQSDSKTITITIDDINDETDQTDTLSASFGTNLVIEQTQARVSVSNTSIGANTYQWTFPEGTPSTSNEETPSDIIYTQNGTYTITLEVSNGTNTDIISTTITINGISNSSDCIAGEGTIITSSVNDLPTYHGIQLKSVFNVNVTKGTENMISINGYENLIEHLDFKVENDILILQFEEGCYNNVNLIVDVTIANLNLIDNSGTGNILINSNFDELENLELNSNATGSIKTNAVTLNVANKLSVNLNGTGGIELNGMTSLLEVNNDGTGTFKGFDMIANEAVITNNSTGNTEINVSTQLEAIITSTGNISYKGTPTIESTISGIGQLIDAN